MKDISSLGTLPHYPVMLEQVLEICQPEKGGLVRPPSGPGFGLDIHYEDL